MLDTDARQLFDAVVKLGIAFALGLPPGWARERQTRSIGLRTYPLLSVCVCGFLVAAKSADWEPREQADALYGVLSGIGFVGSGAMLKTQSQSGGMNTAVSLWVTGAIGAGVAFGGVLVSAALSLATLLTVWAPWFLARRRQQR